MAKPATSLCMIVRDEGQQLAACLGPLADVFDERVVVDTGSRDDTREVAQRCGARVFDFPWCDDFAAARNEALRRAAGDFIFWLDADDRLSPDNVLKLRGLLAGLSAAPQAFLMPCVLRQEDGFRDRERVTSHLRLFRKHPALRWQRRVHEQLVPWPQDLGYEIVRADIRIEHWGYTDPAVLRHKLQRNLRLLEMDLAQSPHDVGLIAELGQTYAQLGRVDEARRCLLHVLACEQPGSQHRRGAFTTLGELETLEQNFVGLTYLLAAALLEFPTDGYLLYMQAEGFYRLRLYAEAKAALRRILDQPSAPELLSIGVPSDLRQRLAPLALAEVHRASREWREAEVVLRRVVGEFPDDAMAWHFLGRVYIDGRDWRQVEEAIERSMRCPRGSALALLLRAEAQRARHEWPAAQRTVEALLTQEPQMLPALVLRAECLHKNQAAADEQRQAWRDVLKVQPRNPRAAEMIRQREQSEGSLDSPPSTLSFGSPWTQ